MRYQALILILVLLVSVTAVKGLSFFAEEGKTETVANVQKIAKSVQKEAVQALESVVRHEEPNNEYVAQRSSVGTAEAPENDACASVLAKVAYVQDMKNGSVLYERNITQRWPIASVTKLMTAVVAMEHYDPALPVAITQSDIDQSQTFATFSAGTTLSMNDMVRSLLVASSNDAAFALADVSGQDAFVQYMNDKAKELGMSQTLFHEPSGLSYLNQSTAADLYLLMRYIQTAHPYLLESTRLKSISVRDTAQKKTKTVANIDLFAGRKDFLGGKTGFIDQSGGNLVTLFRSGSTDLFVAVLGSDDRFGDIEKLLSCAVNHNPVAAAR